MFSIVFWGLIYQLVIIPKTAAASFEVWKKRLKGDPELLLDVCDPLLEEIAEMLTSNFQVLGICFTARKKGRRPRPYRSYEEAIAKGDLFQILAVICRE